MPRKTRLILTTSIMFRARMHPLSLRRKIGNIRGSKNIRIQIGIIPGTVIMKRRAIIPGRYTDSIDLNIPSVIFPEPMDSMTPGGEWVLIGLPREYPFTLDGVTHTPTGEDIPDGAILLILDGVVPGVATLIMDIMVMVGDIGPAIIMVSTTDTMPEVVMAARSTMVPGSIR